MKRTLSFFMYGFGGAMVAFVTMAALASVTYSEGRRHTDGALTYFEQEQDPTASPAWVQPEPRAKAVALPAPTQDECRLPPNRFGEPFIRCS